MQALLDQAVTLHSQGRLAEAERLYSQLLAANPNLMDARHMLGVLKAQQGRPQEAYEWIAPVVAAKLWPGVPVVPLMSAGATDGAFLTPAGIPTYGVSGMFGDPDGNGAHGLNERLRVSSVYKGRDFLYEVVKIYANQN